MTGTDIKSAKSGSYQDSTTGANENVVRAYRQRKVLESLQIRAFLLFVVNLTYLGLSSYIFAIKRG